MHSEKTGDNCFLWSDGQVRTARLMEGSPAGGPDAVGFVSHCVGHFLVIIIQRLCRKSIVIDQVVFGVVLS